MNKTDVQIALNAVAEAKHKWAVASTKFNSDVTFVMSRLLNEAAANMMSAEEVAKESGFTAKRVRMLMRWNNLNPKNGKRLLAKQAAETLATNATIMGIEPREMDLTSPLAYLPMGQQMRQMYTDKRIKGVTELPDEDTPTEDGEIVSGYTSISEAVHDLHLRGGDLRYVCPTCGERGTQA